MAKKRMIERTESVFLDTCIVSLKDLEKSVQDLIFKYGEDAIFHLSNDDYGHKEMTIRYVEEETDKERDKRLANRKKIREDKKKQQQLHDDVERQTFERLKKKFGDK